MAGLSQIKAGELAQEEQVAAAPPGPGERPMMGRGQFEPTPEQIDHILAELKEKNPQKADELAQLRENNPEAFKVEMRNIMREQFMTRMHEQRGEQGRPFDNVQGRRQQQGQMPQMQGPGPDFMREKIQERTEEFMKCLRENYPDEAAKLEQLKNDNPEQYMRAMMLSGKKYGQICQAAKDDPNLAKVLKQQMELKGKRAELLKQIRTTTDEKEKKTLTTELEQIVGQQFDLIVKRKQMAYEDLAKKLADLQKEVDQKKTEVEKWKSKDYKNQKVKERVTELLNEKEKFEWDN
jgi:predicted ArsR family transcriptional regulator